MKKYQLQIRRVDMGAKRGMLDYPVVFRSKSMQRINAYASSKKWKWHPDRSIFGGYWTDPKSEEGAESYIVMNPSQLTIGTRHEREHTRSKRVAAKIARTHLKKHPRYYAKLKKCGLNPVSLSHFFKWNGWGRNKDGKRIPLAHYGYDSKGKGYEVVIKEGKMYYGINMKPISAPTQYHQEIVKHFKSDISKSLHEVNPCRPKKLSRNPLLMVVPNPKKKSVVKNYYAGHSLLKAIKQARANARHFNENYYIFSDTSGNLRAERGHIPQPPYKIIYPSGKIKNVGYSKNPRGKAIKISSNPSFDQFKDDIRFQEAMKKYYEFHGCYPTKITRHLLPIGSNSKVEGSEFFVALGTAPAESYEPPSKSRKAGKIYVHKFDSKPMKAVDRTGKFIVTIPGSHKVSDWIRG